MEAEQKMFRLCDRLEDIMVTIKIFYCFNNELLEILYCSLTTETSMSANHVNFPFFLYVVDDI